MFANHRKKTEWATVFLFVLIRTPLVDSRLYMQKDVQFKAYRNNSAVPQDNTSHSGADEDATFRPRFHTDLKQSNNTAPTRRAKSRKTQVQKTKKKTEKTKLRLPSGHEEWKKMREKLIVTRNGRQYIEVPPELKNVSAEEEMTWIRKVEMLLFSACDGLC